jgi:TRAP-type C4-dicarboxylate transport system permease small subunit
MAMKLWAGAARVLELTTYYLSALLLIALTAVIGYVVFMRYVFNSAPGWSEEVPRVIFLWMSYLAIGVAIQRGHNLRVMFVIERFAPGPRLGLELFMHAAVFVMLFYLLRFNMPILELTAGTKLLATGWPDSILHWPLTVGCVLMALFQLRQVMRSVEDYRAGVAARMER